MYVEADNHARIIIQDLTTRETSFIRECIAYYLQNSCSYKGDEGEFLHGLEKQLETISNG